MTTMPLPRRDLTDAPPACLETLFRSLDAHAGPVPIESLVGMVRRLEVTTESLGDAIQIDAARYVRTLVYRREHAEVFVMAWLPGQCSPIHDHAGSACAVRVVSGAAVEQRFALNDDGSVSRAGDPDRLEAGGVTGSVDSDIHTVANAATGPAPTREILVTIHVYSPPLNPTGRYVERG
jgi:cysteine dioxygenase